MTSFLSPNVVHLIPNQLKHFLCMQFHGVVLQIVHDKSGHQRVRKTYDFCKKKMFLPTLNYVTCQVSKTQ